MEEEKDEEECGDTSADRLTHSLLMQTVPQRSSTNRRRQDSREYRCVCVCVSVCGFWIHKEGRGVLQYLAV